MEQALYYVYENISGLNGGSPADFKHNLDLAFKRSGINSWQKQLTLKAIFKIADMANSNTNFYGINYFDSSGHEYSVGISNAAGFQSENRFSYKGMNIDRVMSGKKETTADFFDKIIDVLKTNQDNGKGLFDTSEGLAMNDFSNEDLHLILKSYWQRDMSNRVLQDLVNLADSLYFTNPYTGVYEQNGGNTRPIGELTNKEIIRLKRASQKIQGSYRQDERSAAELYALGKMFLQFKKYIPGQLKNWFSSKYKDTSIGYYKLRDDGQTLDWTDPQTGETKQIPVMEWYAQVTQGKFGLLIGSLGILVPTLKRIPGMNKAFNLLGIDTGEKAWEKFQEGTGQKSQFKTAVDSCLDECGAYHIITGSLSRRIPR